MVLGGMPPRQQVFNTTWIATGTASGTIGPPSFYKISRSFRNSDDIRLSNSGIWLISMAFLRRIDWKQDGCRQRKAGAGSETKRGQKMRMEIGQGGVAIDCKYLGPLLGLTPADVCTLLREGEITGAVEVCEDEDKTRFQVTYGYRGTRLAFIVAHDGEVIYLQKSRTRLH